MLWAPLTNRLSANNALQDSDKTAQGRVLHLPVPRSEWS